MPITGFLKSGPAGAPNDVITRYDTTDNVAATKYLRPDEAYVRGTTGTAKLSLVLPHPSECVGQLFVFFFDTDGTGDIDLDDPNGDINLTFADADDYWVGIATPKEWIQLANNGGS